MSWLLTKIPLLANTGYTPLRGKTIHIFSRTSDSPGAFTTLLRLDASFMMPLVSADPPLLGFKVQADKLVARGFEAKTAKPLGVM